MQTFYQQGEWCGIKLYSSFLQQSSFSYFLGIFLSQSHSRLFCHTLTFGKQVISLAVLPTSRSEAKNVSETVGVSCRQQQTESDINRQTASLRCRCGSQIQQHTHWLLESMRIMCRIIKHVRMCSTDKLDQVPKPWKVKIFYWKVLLNV